MPAAYLELKDKFGNDLRFGNGGDIWYPPFPLVQDYRQHVKDIRQVELRPDDILVTGFPKTGEVCSCHMLAVQISSRVAGGGVTKHDSQNRVSWVGILASSYLFVTPAYTDNRQWFFS